MWIRTLAFVAVPVLAGALAAPARAKDKSPGPGVPIWPLPGQKDWQLWERAVRIQSGMWFHISPEGVLVPRHRIDATAEQLSHDALHDSDVSIWTGCYAASQACRWHVTRDPDALEMCRTLARGLATIGDVTGSPERVARNLGRPIPGEPPGPDTVPSPRGDGLWYHPNTSRDQLTGVTLGWAALWRFVDDPEVRDLARRHAPHLASRLYADGMEIRDVNGQRTDFGKLSPTVDFLPFRKNGMHAAIGLSVIVTGMATHPGSGLETYLDALREDGWVDALPQQNMQFAIAITGPDVNMAHLACLACALVGPPEVADGARAGLRMLRSATVGWWNAGACACSLLAGGAVRPHELVGEIRRTLHDMPEQEIPPGGEILTSLDRITTVVEKGGQEWTWSDSPRRLRTFDRSEGNPVRITYTRADWLFAYWLARAAGALTPLVGPGADPATARVPVRRPPWMAAPTPAPR